MRIAVTAASGRLGTATLGELAERLPAANIVAVARDPNRVTTPDVVRRAADYADPRAMTDALTGCEVVLMISAPVAGGGDRLALHRNVIDAAVAAGVRKLVYTSVIGNERAESTYFAPFYRVNAATEQYLKGSGLTWVIARNGLYLDLDLRHIFAAAGSDGVYRNNAGEGRCGYISIAELACALAEIVVSDRCDGMAVNLFGELCTQAELVEYANQAYGLQVRYEPISLEENIARFMRDESIAARGVEVAQMLSGCFQCMANGAYEVMPHYRRAAGRDAKSIPEQLATLGPATACP